MIKLFLIFAFAILFVAGIIAYLLKRIRDQLSEKPDTSNDKPNVLLLVLGDIGRSPRMQYHALSLAENNFNVNFVEYKSNDNKK